MFDNKRPSRAKAFPELLLILFPNFEIKNPEIGIKKKTKTVNFQLIAIIALRVKKMVKGSRIIIKTLIKVAFIVFTSPVILAIRSPFRSLEKKATFKLITLR